MSIARSSRFSSRARVVSIVRATVVASAGLWGALAIGCSASSNSATGGDGGTAHVTSPQSASSFCGDYCGKVAQCDQATDQDTCTNACTNQAAATFPKLRSDVVDLIAQCIAQKDCKSVLGGAVLDACVAEAAASIAPSQAAADFCDAYVAESKKCGGLAEDKATCLTRTKLYNDDAIGAASGCTSKACSDVDACVDAALGGLGSGSFLPSGGEDAGAHKKDAAPAPVGDDGGSGSFTCPAVQDTSTCGQCVAASCCTEASNCRSNPSCTNLLSCVQSCAPNDTACYNNCQQQNPGGVSDYQMLGTCVHSACAPSCG